MSNQPTEYPQMGPDSPYQDPEAQHSYDVAKVVDELESERAARVGAIAIVGEANAIRTNDGEDTLLHVTESLAKEIEMKTFDDVRANKDRGERSAVDIISEHPRVIAAKHAKNVAKEATSYYNDSQLDGTPAEKAWDIAQTKTLESVDVVDKKLAETYKVAESKADRQAEADTFVVGLRNRKKTEQTQ
jgi:hypothetical protein